MNQEEINIIKSLAEEVLGENELQLLKTRVITDENYSKFLDKFLQILIEKDKSISLLDFLSFNELSEKYLIFKTKITDILEELAELSFKGHSSENIEFLLETKNEVFLNHLHFLSETRTALAISERAEIKKKLKHLDALNEFELTDDELKTAVTILERKRLKQYLKDIEEDGAKIFDLNFKSILKYAAVIIFIIVPAFFIVNYLNKDDSNKKPQLAQKKQVKKIDTIAKHKDMLGDKLKMPEADQYSQDNSVLQEKSFGFASGEIKKINITIVNIATQINVLENYYKLEIERASNKGYGAIANIYRQKFDSLSATKETYTYDKITGKLVIYSSKLKADKKTVASIKLLGLEQNNKKILYTKIENKYYLIIEQGNNSKLLEELNEDIIDRLNQIGN